MGWITYSGLFRLPVTQWGGFLHLTWSFFSLWFALCLYSPLSLIELLLPNYNFVSILMTVLEYHCHQGSQEKLVFIYSFFKNSLSGALSFVCHYVNHVLIFHCWDFIYKKPSATIKAVKEFLYLCIDMGLEIKNEDQMKMTAAWELLIQLNTLHGPAANIFSLLLYPHQLNCSFFTTLTKLMNTKNI